MIQNNNFYVYAYIRAEYSATAPAGTPYYIGKGKDNRAFINKGCASTPKDQSLIKFIATDLTESVAHSLEIELIAKYGR